MADLVRQMQAAILLAADTLHLWRDVGIAALALIAIGLIHFAASAAGD